MKRRFDILITASEAFPAFETEFMNARHEIIASFRIFDPETPLRSERAKAIGKTWADLITATLNRGVRITLTISDFDPVVAPRSHIYTWACVRRLNAAAQASDNPAFFKATASMHPARVGLLPRLLLWPRLVGQLQESLDKAKDELNAELQRDEHAAPRLLPLAKRKNGKWKARLFPPPPLHPATHHQKIAVFDRTNLYVGGLDLNDHRYDTVQHDRAAKDTWRDVQMIVDGPVAQEAAEHLENFNAVTQGFRAQPTKYLLRTLSQRRRFALPFLSPRKNVQELADIHLSEISKSTRLIYLESQFLRDRKLAKHLAKQAKRAPDLRVIVVLPVAPEEAAFDDTPGSDVAFGDYLQTKCIRIMRRAFRGRLFIGSPLQPRKVDDEGRATDHDAPLVYVHSKVSIFDDRRAIVSSANLNGRSLGWDSEAGIATQTPQEVAALTQRCFSNWLGPDADDACFHLVTAQQAWMSHAHNNARLAPEARKGFILPHSTEAAAKFGYNLPGVPDEMV